MVRSFDLAREGSLVARWLVNSSDSMRLENNHGATTRPM